MKLKRILSLLIVLAMVFSTMGTVAFASDNVAKVGNTEYATIDEAIKAWTDGTTLTLLADVTLSDVITLKSTEHHILDLSTYTMTAASGKNAIVIKAYGTGDAEQYAITIKADAANPGGINAGSKCVIYYKYADGGISTNDRPIIKINGGVFTGSTSSWGTAGIYTIGDAARKCATLNISGGTFNCSINGSGKSKLIISGGTFNYSVGSQGDSTALRLISGGTFKTLGFMTADSNNTKFWIGTSMGNSNVGVHVDDNGYIVIGGPVVTEAGETFEASSANYSGANSLLQYSSAKDNGLYYTSVEEALKDNSKASDSVNVYTDTIDMTGINYKGTIVVPEGETVTILNAPENATFKVEDTAGNVLEEKEDGSYAKPPVSVTTESELKEQLALNTAEIVLANDITITSAITTSAVTSTIDLNGKTLKVGAGDNKFTDETTLTIKNGNIDITGVQVKGNAVFCLDEYEKTLVTTLNLEDVNLTGNGYSSAYGVFYIGSSSILNVTGGEWTLSYDTHASGGVFKADDSDATLNIKDVTMALTNVRRVVTYADTTIENSTVTISGDANEVDAEMEHGFNRSPLTIIDSSISMANMVGRGITAQNGAVEIKGTSTVTMENVQEATIDVRNNQTVTIANTATVTLDKEPTVSEGSTISGIVDVANYVATVNDIGYKTLEEAFKAATEGCTIELLKDVTVDYKWDCRDYATNGSHSQFKESVTINGNNHTIKFTGTVNDNNWNTIFRFEENATVKDLTVDISEATGAQRVITAKKSLDVDNLTIKGSAKYGIIFGEGAGADELAVSEISITNSDLNGTRRAISDNEGGKDVKSVTITDNTLNSNVYVSAYKTVTFKGNTMTAGFVNITSYTSGNTLDVTATDNTLTLNTDTTCNEINAGGTVNAQDDFVLPAYGTLTNCYTSGTGYWGECGGNAKESFVIKFYNNDTYMGYTSLNNIGGIIDGDVYVSWNIKLDAESNTDEYWDMAWEISPTVSMQPNRAEQWVDGVKVKECVVEPNWSDGIFPVIASVSDNNGKIISYVNNTQGFTLKDAFANGGNIVMLKDITLSENVTVPHGKTVVLDLNGKTLTYNSTNQNEAMITNKGNLTINDSVGTGVINYNYTGAADSTYSKGNYTISNAGTLTVNGGKITIANLRAHAKYPIDNNSTTGDAILVVNGGHLYNYNTSAIRQFCNSKTNKNSVTINGGLIEGYSAIWVQNPGAETVNGSLNITGGELRTTASAYVNGTSELKDVSSAIYCTVAGEGGAWDEESLVNITGGTINENVYLSEDAPANLNVNKEICNGYVELPVISVAKVGEKEYTDILEAIKAAAPSGTVELLCDVTVDKWIMFSETLSIGNGNIITLTIDGLTINGNGYTLTVNDVESAGNGNHLFYDGDYNICDLNLVMGENVNGLGITSGTINGVTFIGGCETSGGAAIHVNDGLITGVHAGNVTIEDCIFKNNGGAIYSETAQNGLVVKGNAFQIPSNANVIMLRGTEQFKNNTVISGRTVNVVSGSPVVTGNDFGGVRLKVYNDAEATIENNTINVLAFNDSTATKSTFTNNTLSDDAKVSLDNVTPKAAYIGETGYETIQAAIAAAKDGDTVTISAGEYSAVNISNKNITLTGTVGENGELLTTIKGGNTAITGHGFNGTIKNIKIEDAWRVMYAEPAGNVTVDNVYVTGATYGFHLIAYSNNLTWKIENSYMDISWANSFGVYGNGDAEIIVKGNEFVSTNPYYPDYGALHVNSFLPSVTVEENIFGENARIYIDKSVTDTSKVNISKNYHADGIENAFADDVDGVKVKIPSYYANVDADGNLTNLVEVKEPVAKIGEEEFTSLKDAIDAAKTGDTITMIADAEIAEGTDVTIPDGVTLNGNGFAILSSGADHDTTTSYGYVVAGGNLTIEGITKIEKFSASYYDHTITIGENASLEVFGKNRVTMAYGNIFNITGTITDAKTTVKDETLVSLSIPAGISVTGGNDAEINVKNAYVSIGSTTSKNSGAGGTFNFNFENSIVEFTSNFVTSLTKAGYDLTPVFNINVKDSVLTTASHMELWHEGSNMTVDNSNVTIGSSFANGGALTVKNGAVMNVANPIMSSHGGNKGNINVEDATLDLTGGNQAWESEGTINLTEKSNILLGMFDNKGTINVNVSEGANRGEYTPVKDDDDKNAILGAVNVNGANSYTAENGTIVILVGISKNATVRNIKFTDEDGIERCQIYFFSGIDSLKYKEVGFEVTLDGVTKTLSATTVYTGITVKDTLDNSIEELTPADFGNNINYIFTHTINFNSKYKDYPLTYVPYAIDLSNNKIYGKTSTIDKIYEDLTVSE